MWLTHWAFQFFQSSVSITLRQTSSHAVSICSVSAVHILQSISCMVNLDFSFIGNLVHCLCPLMGSSMHCTLSNKHSLLFLTVAYKISCLVVSSISSCPVVSSISCSVVSITVSFLTLSFDVVLDIFLRQLWWKGFTSVINHVSALYDWRFGLVVTRWLRST